MKFVLASASPRRRELLRNIGINAEIFPSNIDESAADALPPDKAVSELAMLKAASVAKTLGKGFLVIAADTLVCLDGEILGKPGDSAEAKTMLKKLSGSWHSVYTGYCVFDSSTARAVSKCSVTRVKFRELTDGEIALYVKSREPMDKAGAYGIQKLGSLLIEKIEGDYFTVVGLPVCALGELLKNEFDIQPLKGEYK